MDYTLGPYHSISECHSVHARDPTAKGGCSYPLLRGLGWGLPWAARQLQGASAASGFWLKGLFIIVPRSSQLISTLDH